jgi:hypothetical protein
MGPLTEWRTHQEVETADFDGPPFRLIGPALMRRTGVSPSSSVLPRLNIRPETNTLPTTGRGRHLPEI